MRNHSTRRVWRLEAPHGVPHTRLLPLASAPRGWSRLAGRSAGSGRWEQDGMGWGGRLQGLPELSCHSSPLVRT